MERMKTFTILAAIAMLAGPAFAARQVLNESASPSSKGTLNTNFSNANKNFVELYATDLLKANASNIAFEAATWADLKILDTTHTTAGTGIAIVQDAMAYGNADDAYHLWSIDKIGSELAGKQAKNSGIPPVCTVIPATVDTDDYPIFKAPAALTITGGSIHVYATGGTSVTGGLDECTGTNGTCGSVTAVDSDIVGTAGTDVADDGTLTNGTIASGNWIRWRTQAVSGSNTSLSVCFSYTLD